MKLSNRLIYFMGGFLIGICILIFIWDKKNTKFVCVLVNPNEEELEIYSKLIFLFQSITHTFI